MRRRDLLLLPAAFAGVAPRAYALTAPSASPTAVQPLSPPDREFLEELEHRMFLYFWEQTDPNTGLTLDRAGAEGGRASGPSRDIASSAATGFCLTALCIGAENGWITRAQAYARVRSTLHFLSEHAYHDHGWFYHWMEAATGERRWESEISSVDTAFALAGTLTAGRYFSNDPEIPKFAKNIYERVDFPWMLNGDHLVLSHGFMPGKGFLKHRWDTYSEASLLYLLGIGSPTHPLDSQSWYAWQRPLYTYGPYRFISGGPLFTHQYSHAWVDFRKRRDEGFIDFFSNSVWASRANHLFCQNLEKMYPKSFDSHMWGVTASDGIKGYKTYSEIPNFEPVDGTIAPCAAGGSLMFTPDISIAALREMRERFGDSIYRRYGFIDAFNPNSNWFDKDVIAIDVGITLLSADNLLHGNVWRWFMSEPRVQRGMDLAQFSLPEPLPPRKRKTPPRRRTGNTKK